MKKTKKIKHIGSNFDNFLKEEGIFEEVEAGAIKKVIAYELELAMKKNKITQTKMAEALETSRAAVKRILDPENDSMTLITLNRIAHVLGKTLDIRFIDIKK